MTEYKRFTTTRLVWITNITVCVVAILYFLSFLQIQNAPASLLSHIWFLVLEAAFIIPQVFILALFLGVEAKASSAERPHLISLAVILVTAGLGLLWTEAITDAIAH